MNPGNGQVPFTTSDGYQWLYVYGLTSTGYGLHYGFFSPVSNTVPSALPEGAVYSVVLNSADYTQPLGLNQIHITTLLSVETAPVCCCIQIVGGVVTSVDIVRNVCHMSIFTSVTASTPLTTSINQNSLNPEGNGLFDATIINQPSGFD